MEKLELVSIERIKDGIFLVKYDVVNRRNSVLIRDDKTDNMLKKWFDIGFNDLVSNFLNINLFLRPPLVTYDGGACAGGALISVYRKVQQQVKVSKINIIEDGVTIRSRIEKDGVYTFIKSHVDYSNKHYGDDAYELVEQIEQDLGEYLLKEGIEK